MPGKPRQPLLVFHFGDEEPKGIRVIYAFGNALLLTPNIITNLADLTEKLSENPSYDFEADPVYHRIKEAMVKAGLERFSDHRLLDWVDWIKENKFGFVPAVAFLKGEWHHFPACKICTNCKELKPTLKFHKNGPRYDSFCASCRASDKKTKRKQQPEKRTDKSQIGIFLERLPESLFEKESQELSELLLEVTKAK
jgi:hypothetical protein